MSYLDKYFRGKIATSVLREVGVVQTINSQSIRVLETDYNDDVSECSGIVAGPTAGGSGYAVGCEYVDTDASAGAQVYINEGSNTSCSFVPLGNPAMLQTVEIALTEANIIAMNGAPVELVAGQAGKAIEFLGAFLVNEFDTAGYTNGGNVSVIEEDGSDVSTVVGASDSFGSTTDELNIMKPLAASYQPVAGKGLMITNASAAFADPGTAAGIARVSISYRVHTTGL